MTINILQIAIDAEGGPANLARALGLENQSNINNWMKRGLPHMVDRLLKQQYAKQISAAIKAEKLAAKANNKDQ